MRSYDVIRLWLVFLWANHLLLTPIINLCNILEKNWQCIILRFTANLVIHKISNFTKSGVILEIMMRTYYSNHFIYVMTLYAYKCTLHGCHNNAIFIAPMIEMDNQADHRNSELKAELDRRKKVNTREIYRIHLISTQAKSVVVPVDDGQVKAGLREHGQPACK